MKVEQAYKLAVSMLSPLIQANKQRFPVIAATLFVFAVYIFLVLPIKTENKRIQMKSAQLQSDLIETRSLLGGTNETSKNEFFNSPKGSVFAETLKKSLRKFRIRDGVISVTEGSLFTVTASLDIENMETLDLWLSHLRMQYALRPIEMTITWVQSSQNEPDKASQEPVVNLFRISIRLQGMRI
jgi:hypothetical protein